MAPRGTIRHTPAPVTHPGQFGQGHLAGDFLEFRPLCPKSFPRLSRKEQEGLLLSSPDGTARLCPACCGTGERGQTLPQPTGAKSYLAGLFQWICTDGDTARNLRETFRPHSHLCDTQMIAADKIGITIDDIRPTAMEH